MLAPKDQLQAAAAAVEAHGFSARELVTYALPSGRPSLHVMLGMLTFDVWTVTDMLQSH
jgi:hypothetical protein